MHSQRLVRIALTCAVLAGCAPVTPPPPDPDALPASALPLAFSMEWLDSLECARNDCADWFRMEVPAVGELVVTVVLDGAAAPADALGVRATLIDPVGIPLMRVGPKRKADGTSEIRHRARTKPGTYLLGLFSAEGKKRVGYRLDAEYTPAVAPAGGRPAVSQPPPKPNFSPKPSFQKQRTTVLEVEDARSAAPTVRLEAGAADRIVPGLRGRLLEKGHPIAELVVVEVYPDGCRARVEKHSGGPITPRTVAEIEVPVEVPVDASPPAPAPRAAPRRSR